MPFREFRPIRCLLTFGSGMPPKKGVVDLLGSSSSDDEPLVKRRVEAPRGSKEGAGNDNKRQQDVEVRPRPSHTLRKFCVLVSSKWPQNLTFCICIPDSGDGR